MIQKSEINKINNQAPHAIFSDAKNIQKWLDSVSVKKYTLKLSETYGFVVDVDGDVYLDELKLKEIPVKFNYINGSFYISYNQLTSLYCSPQELEGSFYCENNQLKSLSYGPRKVKKDYSCYNNLLLDLTGAPSELHDFDCSQNYLTSLQGGPQKTRRNYFATNNLLTTLKGGPDIVGLSFNVDSNKLKNLEGGPLVVGQYVCSNNDIQNLAYFPKQIKSNFICSGNPQLGARQEQIDWRVHYKDHLIEGERLLIEQNTPKIAAPELVQIRPKIKL